jgi:hypothetical protein
MKEVLITIDTQGNISSEAVGFIGAGCMKATEFLEKLGSVKNEFKSEYFQKEHEQERLRGC